MTTTVVTTQFQKGVSGNPAGRKKGSKNKATILREEMELRADKMLSKKVPAVLKVVIEKAIEGDMTAAKMILDRAVPVKKAGDGADTSLQGGIAITITNLTADSLNNEKVIEGEVL